MYNKRLLVLFAIMMASPVFGKVIWDKIVPSEDINLNTSFTGRDSCNTAELKFMWG
jgi:hypothetical protein